MAVLHGDAPRAASLFEESLARFRPAGDAWNTGWALAGLGHSRGAGPETSALFAESLEHFQSAGDPWGVALAHEGLGNAAEAAGDLAAAVTHYEAGLAGFRAVGEQRGFGLLALQLGMLAQRMGDVARAVALQRESLAALQELGDRDAIAFGLDRLGTLAVHMGDDERAARILGAAEALHELVGDQMLPGVRVEVERVVDTLRTTLTAKRLTRAWADGRAMPLNAAIADALQLGAASTGRSRSGTSLPAGLTSREADVLRLVAAGLTNREIAERLFVTVYTVERHLVNVYRKIDARGRADATAFALRHGIVDPQPD